MATFKFLMALIWVGCIAMFVVFLIQGALMPDILSVRIGLGGLVISIPTFIAIIREVKD